jgi:hypothetical protein
MIVITEYGESNVIFCKIDVDKSKVAQSMGITSMPSFKIIKDAVEVLHISWRFVHYLMLCSDCFLKLFYFDGSEDERREDERKENSTKVTKRKEKETNKTKQRQKLCCEGARTQSVKLLFSL